MTSGWNTSELKHRKSPVPIGAGDFFFVVALSSLFFSFCFSSLLFLSACLPALFSALLVPVFLGLLSCCAISCRAAFFIPAVMCLPVSLPAFCDTPGASFSDFLWKTVA